MTGNRRIDRVLDPGFVQDITSLSLDQVRERRDEAIQEEVDLSYLRRLLQGRIDIINAELRHRAGEAGTLVEQLPQILADTARPGAPRGLGRHMTVEPSRADMHRRHVEALVADVDISDVTARSEDELQRALELFQAEERAVSEKRHAVQEVADAFAAEMARRYRDGEADISTLLPVESDQ